MKKGERQKVFEKCDGRCAYCGCELNDKWQVDHIVSRNYFWLIDPLDMTSVNCMSNYNPSCKECNHYKRSHTLEDVGSSIGFRSYMKKFHIRLGRLPKKTMRSKTLKTKMYMQIIADKYGITADKPFSGIFYYETIKTYKNEKS